MTVSFSRATALQIIANEKMGFHFGVPMRPYESSLSVVLPILRTTSVKRHYVTLPEIDKHVDIADTGKIDKMRFTNKSTENVFVRSGTMLKGSTQERALIRSSVLLPGQTVELECRCIHQTRGIQHNAKVEYGGITPLSFDQMSYGRSYSARTQTDFWQNASAYNTSVSNLTRSADDAGEPIRGEINIGERRTRRPEGRSSRSRVIHSSTRSRTEWGNTPIMDSAFSMQEIYGGVKQDDLAANLGNFASTFADLLSKVELHKNQVGLGLLSVTGCETVELFDLDDSWSALHSDAVKRVGSNVVRDDSADVFKYDPEKAVAAVKSVLAMGFDDKILYEHRPSNGEPAVTISSLSNDKYTGEVVELDGRVIHLVLLRMVNA